MTHAGFGILAILELCECCRNVCSYPDFQACVAKRQSSQLSLLIYLIFAQKQTFIFCLHLRHLLPCHASLVGRTASIRQEVLEEFLRLFPLLFSANQNARFCQAVTSSFERRQWKRLSAGLRNAAKMAREKVRYDEG